MKVMSLVEEMAKFTLPLVPLQVAKLITKL
jgi:hypothetical protein